MTTNTSYKNTAEGRKCGVDYHCNLIVWYSNPKLQAKNLNEIKVLVKCLVSKRIHYITLHAACSAYIIKCHTFNKPAVVWD